MGNRFFEGQLPALIRALTKLGEKQTACNVIAAGIHASSEGMTPDGAARRAIETYETIERKLKACTS
jgi:hypothetical protein